MLVSFLRVRGSVEHSPVESHHLVFETSRFSPQAFFFFLKIGGSFCYRAIVCPTDTHAGNSFLQRFGHPTTSVVPRYDIPRDGDWLIPSLTLFFLYVRSGFCLCLSRDLSLDTTDLFLSPFTELNLFFFSRPFLRRSCLFRLLFKGRTSPFPFHSKIVVGGFFPV